MVNYLTRFCKDLATKYRYLHEQKGSIKQFTWTYLYKKVLQQVKELIISHLVLKPNNYDFEKLTQ